MLKELIKSSNKILLFSGAGVSTGSGLPDFRSKSGLYSKSDDPVTLLSRDTYRVNPQATISYILENFIVDESIQPNLGHQFAVDLDHEDKLLGVITQNVDGLYQRAGLNEHKLVEIHGSAERFFCLECQRSLTYDEVDKDTCLSKCCKSQVDTDVVLYGDNFDEDRFYQYQQWISEADLIIVMGTTLHIQAHMMNIMSHPKVILLNNEDIDFLGQNVFKEKYIGDINDTLLKEYYNQK